MKKPAHDMALAVNKKVEDINVAVKRFMNVAIDIALTRMHVANISDGISQEPGPMPMLKNAR
jgi:hypothetical protein